MHWFLFALLAAISESLKDLCSKQGLRSITPQLAALAASTTPIPLLVSIILITNSIPSIGPQYLPALMIGGSLNILALFQFMRALQSSDISLAIPFISFTPIFLLITSPLLVNDIPTTQDVLGILSIVAGAYLLQIHSIDQGYLAPFTAMLTQPGPRRMLSVAVIYSITSNFDKIGIQNSSPIFWSLSITSIMAIGFALIVLLNPQNPRSLLKSKSVLFLVLIGLFQTAGLLFHNIALGIGPVPSVIATKRSSILFAMLWGFLLLQERNLRERLSGTLFMLLGIGLLGWE